MEDFDKFVGVRWEPYAGTKGGFELRSKVRLPVDPAELTETAKGKIEFTRRRLKIKKEDLAMFGYTAGCPGCRAANKGTTAMSNTEECRTIVAEEFEKQVRDERLECARERLFEYQEEKMKKKKKKEKKKKKAKSGESEQKGEASNIIIRRSRSWSSTEPRRSSNGADNDYEQIWGCAGRKFHQEERRRGEHGAIRKKEQGRRGRERR